MKDFAAIDFETANSERSSVCSVGIVIVRNGEIVDSKGIIMIQHLQNSLPVLILSTPYSVLEYSILSTGVFHTMYCSIPY